MSVPFKTAELRSVGPRGRAADDLGRAVLYMVFAAALIPLLNASAKYLSTKYPAIEVTWARYAGHFVVMLVTFLPRRGWRLLAAARPGLQIVRSTLLCTSTFIFISALPYVTLPTATAMTFTTPLLVTALAPLLLGERVGLQRWAAVVLGFAGAVLVLQPGGASMQPAAFILLASALSSALYQILTRVLASHDSAETSITYIALAGFVLTSLPLPFVWKTPDTLLDLALFLGLGVFGGFGHYFIVRAFELAPAPVVAPFNYAQLIGAVLLSYVFFHQLPDLWVWIGSAVIILSGILLLSMERLRSTRASELGASRGLENGNRRAEQPPLSASTNRPSH